MSQYQPRPIEARVIKTLLDYPVEQLKQIETGMVLLRAAYRVAGVDPAKATGSAYHCILTALDRRKCETQKEICKELRS